MSPAAFTSQLVHYRLCRAEKLLYRIIGCIGNKAVSGKQRLTWKRRVQRVQRLFVQLHQRGELFRTTTDNRKHKWQPEQTCTDNRFLITATANPDRKLFLHRAWVDARLLNEGRCLPDQVTFPTPSASKADQFLVEQFIIIAQIITEQRE